MAPKRPAAAASGSASETSDAEADAGHHQPSSPSPSKTPPPNPNPKSAAAGPTSVAEDSTAVGSDSEAAYDSDADHRPAPRKAAAASSPSRKPRSPRPRSRSRSPDAASYTDVAASDPDADADPAAGDGADSVDDDNASPLALRPPRPSRAEAAAIKPLSSRPMDPPRRSMVPSFSEPRSKRPRSVAVPSSVEQLKRPTRLWSLRDEIVILRGLATYRAKRGVLPGSMYDISKLHGHIQSELSVKVTPTQLSDKVRRLKQKYNLLSSRGKNGRDPDLPTQHEQSVYEIGKKVWGASANGGGSTGGDGYEIGGGGDSEEEHEIAESDDDVESGRGEHPRKNRRVMPIAMANGNGAVNANSRGKFDIEKGKDAYPYLWETVEDLSKEHPNGVAFKKAFELIEGPKARGMEEKLRKFRLTEIRHQLRRMELMKETVKMVLDALEG
ncbi:STOREKEEPER protein-like [Miscanthus floridulus]|uniref:STOREKEEPER protein-like n=1 Tax=Miscanthus floridulus TaxID=154761 RepID=UPI00345975F5